ncbi:hypothetical protein RGR602_PC01767 (plasmid) [Rhizobium gallicum bv. gallicum R602sp]|uniref:Uncharacterized protein n=1 Tax=Rhizobium gallicum bv. gallicum R602sp TaxID=1041138 RepID=A0A0B4XFC4_9HYPH|nr:hypothetical protein [Rhizobium gallicum]AJD45791.1 hypothetical protein RGR602_PC01767 [Rhizobium gallicum bv. gallicum R602sp]TDW20871.1 hypothetical protein EV128_12334 [Rhizobium azibense]
MSSETSIRYMTSDDLNLLQGVLKDAGYTDDVLFEQPRPFPIAARLLIGLFQEGTTSPAELTIQLERHFGKPRKEAVTLAVPRFHRFAIQGLPAQRSGAIH